VGVASAAWRVNSAATVPAAMVEITPRSGVATWVGIARQPASSAASNKPVRKFA
jgi:hypothetical protein